MIYSLTLGTAFLIVGALLTALGTMGLAFDAAAKSWLAKFPRSKGWGYGLLGVAAVWFWFLIRDLDLGEFSNWRQMLLIVIPVAAILAAIYVDELLAARALGMVILLAAEPLLESAFLRPELSRLLLVSLTYIALLFAMFWIGMPYVLRDQIQWITQSTARWRAVNGILIAYGLLLASRILTLRHSA